MNNDTETFTIGGHKFTLGINTVRLERGRTSLRIAADRYLNTETFETEAVRRSAGEAFDPFYSDIIGCTRAIDGKSDHELLKQFVYNPRAWEDFFWDNPKDYQSFVDATIWAQQANKDWYPKPQITDEDDPEAARTIADTLASIDLDSTEDVEQPDPQDIREAVQRRADIAKDKRSEDFLG
jgi:hypothetical protein